MKVKNIEKFIDGENMSIIENLLYLLRVHLLPCPFCGKSPHFCLNRHIDLNPSAIVKRPLLIKSSSAPGKGWVTSRFETERPTYFTLTAECRPCGITTVQEGTRIVHGRGERTIDGPPKIEYGLSNEKIDYEVFQKHVIDLAEDLIKKWNRRI